MQISSHCLESEGCDNINTCQVSDNGHSPLERCLKDISQKISQKISQVNEIQEQLVDDEHVIAATVEGMQHTMKSMDKTLGDHEGWLSALDDTQRWVAEEFNNLEMRLASVQKNCILQSFQDGSLKDIQASLANLEANLTSCRHDLKQQVRNKSWTLTLSWVALHDMQETMDSVKTSLEQISGDSSSDMAQSWAYPQLSLEEELCHITHVKKRALKVHCSSTSGAGSAAPSSEAGKNLSLSAFSLLLEEVQLKTQEEVDQASLPYYLSMTLALSTWRVHQIQYTTRWLSLDNDTKAKVKQEVLVTLASSLSRAGGFFAQVVAAIASRAEILSLRSNEILTASAQTSSVRSAVFVFKSFVASCPAGGAQSHKTGLGAFEYLVKIMALYYDKMAFYMEQALFVVCAQFSGRHQGSDPAVSLPVMGFGPPDCEEGIKLAHEACKATDYGELPENKSKHFTKIALPEVIPVLLSLLTLQEEVVDEGERNISMSVGTCFNFMAQAVTDAIVDAVIPFIEAHIKSPDGHQREAAMMAFGSILDGPYPSVLTHKSGHQDNPRIVTNCCWALMSLANQPEFLEEKSVPSQISHLSPYFDGIINALLRVMDTHPEHVDNYFDADAATSRSAVCCQSITWWPGEGIQPMADHIMTLILQLVWAAGKTSTVLEDALVAVGSLASALESNFAPYIIQAFCNFHWYGLDSSIDLHTPLPTLSPNSKLLPQPSTDSLNRRDTPRRQTRHRDEKLLKGGLASPPVWDGLLAPSDLLRSLHCQPSRGIPVMSFLVLLFTTMPATPAVLLDITQHPTGDGERCQVPFVVMMGIIGHGGALLLPLQMSQTWLAFEDDMAHSHSVSVMLAYICRP
ncbi:armadillo-type protein [Pisolithus marmoratus]|nr:armadillo-type protein [Pisolithus marmoratus]